MMKPTQGPLLAGLLLLAATVSFAGDAPDPGPLSGLAGRTAAPT